MKKRTTDVQAVIFDFDGVIHDTFEFHRDKIVKFSGVHLSAQEYRDMHNGNFHAHSVDKMKDVNWIDYRDYIRDDWVCLKIEQDIKRVLAELQKEYKLFVITSGSSNNIVEYFCNNHVDHLFDEVIGLEAHGSKVEKFKHIFCKHELLSENCIFVTDTLGDILEAHKVDVKTIAVTFGYHDENVLKKGKPYKIIERLDHIKLLLKSS